MRSLKTAALLLSVSSLSVLSASWLAVACGGSSGDDISIPDDAGVETSGGDANANPNPNPMDDGGTDGTTVPEGGCAPEGSACLVNDSVKGLCKASSCTACVDTADDGLCKTAYGAGAAGGKAICNHGACVAGDCHSNTDCAGNICGLDTPSTCGGCTSDSACKTSYGSDFICNKTTGSCETNAVACTNADAGTCLGNAADICCAPTAGAAGACTVGNCCTSAQCGMTTPNCFNHVCTGCAAVVDGVYWVDPAQSVADNMTATGNKTDPKCAFRSITSALAAIGNAVAAPVTIKIKMGAAALGPNESFPIIVPTNVTITSEDTANPASILVPAGKEGFVLASPTSGIQYLTIDGQANTALGGVLAQTGSSATTTTLMHVKVKNFGGDGIVIRNATGKTAGGGLAIGPAVSSTGNGTAGAPASGLHVSENGVAVITGAVGAETHFDSNTEDGIRVDGTGQITLTGAVGAAAPTTGTVTTNQNVNVGLAIQQTPGTVPLNTVTGLTAWKTSAGPGIRVLAGSAVKLRASSALGNATDGVHVRSAVNGLLFINDTSKIDLGASAGGDPGKNVLQAITGQNPNVGVGICLEITANTGQILNAYGNTLVTAAMGATQPVSIDCSTTAGQIKKNTGNGACSGGVAIGVIGNAVNTDQVVTLLCTQ